MTIDRHIALIGIKHSGKTSAGRILARKLGVNLSDTDDLLGNLASQRLAGPRPPTVAEVYAKLGERGFGELECEVIAHAVELPPHVIATGGGIADRPQCLERLGARAVLVYLALGVETAVSRVLQRGVPAFVAGSDPGTELVAVFTRRAERYAQVCDVAVETTGLSSAQIAGRIMEGLEASGHGR